MTLACSFRIAAQTSQAASQPATRIDWSTLTERDRTDLAKLLDSKDWPIRVFGMMRLERYRGDQLPSLIRAKLRDSTWQVRCFAIDQAVRLRLPLKSDDFANETDARVIRAAMRYGVEIDDATISKAVTKLLRTEDLDSLTLGIELAAMSDNKVLRGEASQRADRLLRNMDEGIALVVSRRLARVFQLPSVPDGLAGWRTWLLTQRDLVKLPPPPTEPAKPLPIPLLVEMDDETFARLLDYLDGLRQRDLDLVICMDATASMLPMINQARAGIDSLILFLRDISREMRLGFVAYRDHDNPPVCDVQPLTGDITTVRNFLFKVRITGGADLPEAVLEGFQAASDMKWNRKATREIVLVGDAPPHPQDMYRVRALLDGLRDSGFVVHAAHIPMESPPGRLESLAEERAAQEKKEMDDYNHSTDATFAEIAELGGGKKASMHNADELVPAVMHFTIEEGWWPVFDEFYARYLELCR